MTSLCRERWRTNWESVSCLPGRILPLKLESGKNRLVLRENPVDFQEKPGEFSGKNRGVFRKNPAGIEGKPVENRRQYRQESEKRTACFM